MLQINQLRLPITHSPQELEKKIARLLRCEPGDFRYTVLRRSLDARHKDDRRFVYTVDVQIPGEKKLAARLRDPHITSYEPVAYHFPRLEAEGRREQPVIVGSGPAGLFAAWYLARAGLAPLILERGEPVEDRHRTVEAFWSGETLSPESNVQFGEGGAGTFSDGKLNTQVKDPRGRNREVLRRFVKAGAPEDILWEQKPHLGTDVLRDVVRTLRLQIQEMGGTFLFQTKAVGLEVTGGRVTGLRTVSTRPGAGNGETLIPCSLCVLAIGHSARDTFRQLFDLGIPMQAKPFAVGVRVEHPQSLINLSQYGEEQNDILGSAAYKVTHTCGNGRGVYSFCMCPGGYVVNASSEPGRLCVNGMSYSRRSGQNANSAIIVSVRPEDYPEPGPLGGIAYQRSLEEAAFRLAGGRIPVQRYEDFRENRRTNALGNVLPQMKGAWETGNVRGLFSAELADSLQEGMEAFGRKIAGFDLPDVLLSGVESRTSSPVRIPRDPATLQSAVEGLYPCGEGAGYAGGITSAAMDGLKVAEAIVTTLNQKTS